MTPGMTARRFAGAGGLFEADELQRFVREASLRAGVPEEQLPYLADALVEASLRGIDTHGVYRLPAYVRGFLAGQINPAPEVRVVQGRGATTVLDGDNGLGVVVGQLAMDTAVASARQHGTGVVAVRNSNHSGMLAIHVMRATSARMIGHFVSNAPPFMAPWGGVEATLSNGPIAWAIPRAGADPIVLDMACSAVARSRVRLAATEGREIPLGWALDADGRPTRDASEAMEGSIVPMAGHKGYCLAVINEVLAGALTGARLASEMSTSFLAEGATTLDSWGAGHFAQAIDVEAFGAAGAFESRVDQLALSLRGSATPPNEVLLPGEPETRTRDERLRSGVPLSPQVVEQLDLLASEQGIRRLQAIP